MFQRSRKGYVEQQIEMLAEVLARILTGKESGHYEAALAEAADACKRLTGLNLATLTMLPDETLLNLFRMGGGLDPARCVIAARLLDAQADVYSNARKAHTIYGWDISASPFLWRHILALRFFVPVRVLCQFGFCASSGFVPARVQ